MSFFDDWELKSSIDNEESTILTFDCKRKIGAFWRLDRYRHSIQIIPFNSQDPDTGEWYRPADWKETGRYVRRDTFYNEYEYCAIHFNYYNPVDEIKAIYGEKAKIKSINQVPKRFNFSVDQISALWSGVPCCPDVSGNWGKVYNDKKLSKIDGSQIDTRDQCSQYFTAIQEFSPLSYYKVGVWSADFWVMLTAVQTVSVTPNYYEVYLKMDVEISGLEFGLMNDIIFKTDNYSEYLLKKNSGEYRTTPEGNYII